MIEGLVGLGIMMLLCALRVPIAFAMAIVGIAGYAYMRDWNWTVAFAMTQTKLYETGRNYTLSVVPLFILMGNFVTRAGMSQELFRAAYAFIGHLRGGLAMATVWASAGFGGICGSSIATAATFAKVAYPSMKKFGYSDRLAAGVVAGGGTLGIMIPPSTIMVIYGVFTETNIGKLFAAGIVPGIVGAVLLCGAVRYMTWQDPACGPPGERSTWGQRLSTVAQTPYATRVRDCRRLPRRVAQNTAWWSTSPSRTGFSLCRISGTRASRAVRTTRISFRHGSRASTTWSRSIGQPWSAIWRVRPSWSLRTLRRASWSQGKERLH